MTLPQKRFQHVNEGFVCEQCGEKVFPTLRGSPRNHCPSCLFSQHVDRMPGDRSNSCTGLMKPIGVLVEGSDEKTIVHQCMRCNAQQKAPVVSDDNHELVIILSTQPIRD